VAYQQVESYLLVPRIYGRTLHVSPFSILVGVLVGGELLGVIGILLALPITAAIPIVMRIWREEAADPGASPVPLAPSHGAPAQGERART